MDSRPEKNSPQHGGFYLCERKEQNGGNHPEGGVLKPGAVACLQKRGRLAPLLLEPAIIKLIFTILEREVQSDPVGGYLPLFDGDILFDHLGNPQIFESFPRGFQGTCRGVFPGLGAGSDNFHDLVNGHSTFSFLAWVASVNQ